MRNRPSTFAYVVLLMLGTAGLGVAQDGGQQPSAREQLQHIHTPQSIDQKLASLTKDLELTPKQQRQVRPLLQEHHDNIQALLDKYPTASRQDLAPQIHAISDETHRQIHALLTDHQKELEKAMVQRRHSGEQTSDLLRLRQHRQAIFSALLIHIRTGRTVTVGVQMLSFCCPLRQRSQSSPLQAFT